MSKLPKEDLRKMVKSNLKLLQNILTTADKLLIIFAIIVSIVIFILISRNDEKNMLEISYQDKIYGEYNISKPQKIIINPNLIVEIKDDKYRILKSDCKNQICVKQGWNNRFPIICVPNKLSLQLKSEDEMMITQ